MKYLAKFFLLFVVMTSVIILRTNKVQAEMIYSNGEDVPAYFANAGWSDGCPVNGGRKVAQGTWVSVAGSSLQLDATVAQGNTAPLNLDFNAFVYKCFGNQSTTVNLTNYVTNTGLYFFTDGSGNSLGGGTIPTLLNTNTSVTSPDANGRTGVRYGRNRTTFSVNTSGLPAGRATLTVWLASRQYNWFNNNTFVCVLPADKNIRAGTDLYTYSGLGADCASNLVSFTISVNVVPPGGPVLPALPNLTNTCTGIRYAYGGAQIRFNGPAVNREDFPPNGEINLLDRGVSSPATYLYAWDSGSGYAWYQMQNWTWVQPGGCTVPFTVTPVANPPSLTGPEDNPTGANFPGGTVTSPVKVNGINVRCDYTLARANGSTVSLGTSSTSENINGSVGVCGSRNFNISVTAGDKVCLRVTVSPKNGEADYSGNIISGSGSDSDSACKTITSKPYIGAFGGDVRAGGVFGNTCTLATAAKIDTYNGSGSQLAAIASGTIDTNAGFKTFRMNTPGNTLAFANTPSSGNFSNSHCIHDYFNDKPADLVGNLPSSLNGLADGITYVNGDQTINGNTNSFDKHSKVYINGNLTINKNIAFANGPWASRADIPGLQVIVSGNIYIDRAVTQLDGVYVSKGTVYTCAEGVDRANGNAILANKLYDNCNNQLVFNGALIANNVKLLRAFGSNYMAGNSEYPTSSKLCSAGRSGFTCAGEVFNFTPETYLAQWPPTSGGGNNNGAQYDFITALPPIL